MTATWLDKPVHYNGLRNTLSRALAYSIKEGHIERNPVNDIEKADVWQCVTDTVSNLCATYVPPKSGKFLKL